MDVRELIERKKREFFTARDSPGLKEQYALLAQQRREMEEREALRQQVIQEQQAIRGLRGSPLTNLGGGIEAFKNASQRANQFFHGDTPPGLQHAHKRLEGMPTPKGGALDNPKPPILGGTQ